MGIHQYLDKLEGNSKRHVLLIVAPKEKYPINLLEEEYYALERSILKNPRECISLYGDDPNEIMQYVAFRLYIRPIICDKYSMSNNRTDKFKRAKKEEITSFIITKHFFNTVPTSLLSEEESIIEGLTLAKDFLDKFPIDRYEHVLVKVGKDSDEANILIDISFENNNEDYYFDRVYIR